MMKNKATNKTTEYRARTSREDKVYYTVCYTIISLLTLSVLYPLIYVVSSSFSSGSAVLQGKVWLFPVDFSTIGYKAMFNYKNIWIGYRNTVFYTVVGVLINIAMTMMCAYPLARKKLRGKDFFTFLFSFTMLFGGGMIPSYILARNLKLLNTVWAMLLPSAMSVYYMIVARTYLQSNIPDELLEAAQVEGCSDFYFFFWIVLPLSKTIIAVLAMWYGVIHWNSYFDAFLYLTEPKLYPLQLFLREVLVLNDITSDMVSEDITAIRNMKEVLKYSMIVISTAPLMAVYPFFQKYFVKGVMIGSLKG